MKKFGKICIIIGSLSFLGAASTGHRVIGPLFWLALGIIILVFQNNKKQNSSYNANNDKRRVNSDSEKMS